MYARRPVTPREPAPMARNSELPKAQEQGLTGLVEGGAGRSACIKGPQMCASHSGHASCCGWTPSPPSGTSRGRVTGPGLTSNPRPTPWDGARGPGQSGAGDRERRCAVAGTRTWRVPGMPQDRWTTPRRQRKISSRRRLIHFPPTPKVWSIRYKLLKKVTDIRPRA